LWQGLPDPRSDSTCGGLAARSAASAAQVAQFFAEFRRKRTLPQTPRCFSPKIRRKHTKKGIKSGNLANNIQ